MMQEAMDLLYDILIAYTRVDRCTNENLPKLKSPEKKLVSVSPSTKPKNHPFRNNICTFHSGLRMCKVLTESMQEGKYNSKTTDLI